MPFVIVDPENTVSPFTHARTAISAILLTVHAAIVTARNVSIIKVGSGSHLSSPNNCQVTIS